MTVGTGNRQKHVKLHHTARACVLLHRTVVGVIGGVVVPRGLSCELHCTAMELHAPSSDLSILSQGGMALYTTAAVRVEASKHGVVQIDDVMSIRVRTDSTALTYAKK